MHANETQKRKSDPCTVFRVERMVSKPGKVAARSIVRNLKRQENEDDNDKVVVRAVKPPR